jgi:hypothetical protein
LGGRDALLRGGRDGAFCKSVARLDGPRRKGKGVSQRALVAELDAPQPPSALAARHVLALAAALAVDELPRRVRVHLDETRGVSD